MPESRNQFSDELDIKSKSKNVTLKNNNEMSTFSRVGRDFSGYEQRYYKWTDAPEPNKYNLERSTKLKT
jgi:hypothetical protein